ncbi:hypothetical protein KSS87_007309 [Heliosperma pusillum]|nr:hypothetical protein KSS87_007309 [Heliosperma pusillum]
MAAALECWSGSVRSISEDETVEQVLMRKSEDRSESTTAPATSTSAMQKRFQKLSRNVSEAINSLKNSLNIESNPPPSKFVWSTIVRSLTQLYPGSQLPDKLVSNIRKHYDSFPLSYAEAGFEMKDVFVHIRLMEQASVEEQPAIYIEEVGDDDRRVQKITFACNAAVSWGAVSGALEAVSISCSRYQLFEKKGCTLGILYITVKQDDQDLSQFKVRVENALRSAVKKHKLSNRKLPFGLCGCQEEIGRGRDFGDVEEGGFRNSSVEQSSPSIELTMPLPSSSLLVSVDEWQTVRGCGREVEMWLLSSDCLDFTDQIGPTSFKGVYKGKKVAIEKLKGCDKGNAFDFEIRKDLLELMTCGHRNVLPFYGACIDEVHGLCVVTRFMEGGSVRDFMLKHKKIPIKDVVRMATDIAEGLKFMNEHGVAYQDLNTQRIFLDRQGNACLGDMGIVSACKSGHEVMEYETDGYRWLAPEIIAGDPESVRETWMSNAYSYGMVVWEIMNGEAAYSSYSPVQAAVGIAACGLRPDIPKDCPLLLKSLLLNCWNSCPSKRPSFSEILSNYISMLNNR